MYSIAAVPDEGYPPTILPQTASRQCCSSAPCSKPN